jgi:hypothetical protein
MDILKRILENISLQEIRKYIPGVEIYAEEPKS